MASEERRQPEAGGESDGGGGRQRAEARRQAAGPVPVPVAEVPGGAGAALLGETGLALGCCIAAALSWERPLRSLGGFVCANLLFWCVGRRPRLGGGSPGGWGPRCGSLCAAGVG